MEGLKAGDHIIVEGLQKVQLGKPVTPHLVTVDPKTGVITQQTDTKKTQSNKNSSDAPSTSPKKNDSKKMPASAPSGSGS
jgi:membrane fusion protein (multidrug efflux system)